MKKWVVVFVLLLAVGTSAQQGPAVPDLLVNAVEFLKLPPDTYLGEIAGLATDSKGNIYVYSRTGGPGPVRNTRSAQLFEFAKDGKFIR